MRRLELSGRIFGILKVLKLDESKTKNSKWLCECECGNIVSVYGFNLLSGCTKGCGCLSRRKGTERPNRKIVISGYRNTCGGKEHRAIMGNLKIVLPKKAVVHHVNGQKSDNRHGNLVVCENDAYHKLLHRRARALDACGNATWRKCPFCKTYDDTSNLYIPSKNGAAYHNRCKSEYNKMKTAAVKS